MNFVKFLRTPFLQNKPREQLLVVPQKTRFVIKDFFSKYEQANNLQRTYPHMLKKSLIENFIFFVQYTPMYCYYGVSFEQSTDQKQKTASGFLYLLVTKMITNVSLFEKKTKLVLLNH